MFRSWIPGNRNKRLPRTLLLISPGSLKPPFIDKCKTDGTKVSERVKAPQCVSLLLYWKRCKKGDNDQITSKDLPKMSVSRNVIRSHVTNWQDTKSKSKGYDLENEDSKSNRFWVDESVPATHCSFCNSSLKMYTARSLTWFCFKTWTELDYLSCFHEGEIRRKQLEVHCHCALGYLLSCYFRGWIMHKMCLAVQNTARDFQSKTLSMYYYVTSFRIKGSRIFTPVHCTHNVVSNINFNSLWRSKWKFCLKYQPIKKSGKISRIFDFPISFSVEVF